MSVETEISALTQATTNLTVAVNIRKSELDQAVIDAANAADSIQTGSIPMDAAESLALSLNIALGRL